MNIEESQKKIDDPRKKQFGFWAIKENHIICMCVLKFFRNYDIYSKYYVRLVLS